MRNPLAFRALCALLALATLAPVLHAQADDGRVPAPLAAVDELLAADRAFAAAGARTDMISTLQSMFSDDVVMPLPGSRFARGRQEAIEAVRGNPDNIKARLEWAPVRGGVSADALHGFTFGYGTLHRADGTTVPLKYLSYWLKGPQGWRVAAYKRARRPQGAVSAEAMPPAAPAKLVPPTSDPKVLTAHRASLVAAEQAFSDDAQRIGFGPAFARWGSADAMNMGGPDSPGFVVGAAAIGQAVGGPNAGPGSPVSWSADEALVASSGDLGVTFGTIRPNKPPESGAPPSQSSFFTVWRRAGPAEPWRYVAE